MSPALAAGFLSTLPPRKSGCWVSFSCPGEGLPGLIQERAWTSPCGSLGFRQPGTLRLVTLPPPTSWLLARNGRDQRGFDFVQGPPLVAAENWGFDQKKKKIHFFVWPCRSLLRPAGSSSLTGVKPRPLASGVRWGSHRITREVLKIGDFYDSSWLMLNRRRCEWADLPRRVDEPPVPSTSFSPGGEGACWACEHRMQSLHRETGVCKIRSQLWSSRTDSSHLCTQAGILSQATGSGKAVVTAGEALCRGFHTFPQTRLMSLNPFWGVATEPTPSIAKPDFHPQARESTDTNLKSPASGSEWPP